VFDILLSELKNKFLVDGVGVLDLVHDPSARFPFTVLALRAASRKKESGIRIGDLLLDALGYLFSLQLFSGTHIEAVGFDKRERILIDPIGIIWPTNIDSHAPALAFTAARDRESRRLSEAGSSQAKYLLGIQDDRFRAVLLSLLDHVARAARSIAGFAVPKRD